MADICLIYARSSKPIVGALHALLSKRYSVWWDQDIHAGRYREEIERQLQMARCVIPVWCQASTQSDYVVDEAEYAKNNGIVLLPVRIENVNFPIGFGGLQTVDLIGWKGDERDERIPVLMSHIEKALQARLGSIRIAGKTLTLPAFFRSVSSYETAMQPAPAVEALKLVGCDALLVSAYDIIHEEESHREQMIKDLKACRSAGSVVLLDSGNYEASRKKDEAWCDTRFHEALQMAPHDAALSFDILKPPKDPEEHVRVLVESYERDVKRTSQPVLPIVHAPGGNSGELGEGVIPQIIKRVCQELRPEVVAIPERELGDGILARAKMVHRIRNELNTLGRYQPLHLLGTGNPLSVAIFSSVGADCFDGLEWCRTVADNNTGKLYHLQQYDFFSWQSAIAESPIVQEAVASASIGFAGKVIFHNLDFFARWMKELRAHVNSGKVERFLTDKLPLGKDSMQDLEKAVPEVFG